MGDDVNYDKTKLNAFVKNLYDQKIGEGKHGHYETMFHVVHEAIKHTRPLGWRTPQDRYTIPVLFNPYTGEPRDVRDVSSDPNGQLIIPPGCVDLYAAQEWDSND